MLNSFSLELGPTYYNKGFFNVPKKFGSFISPKDSKVKILLGNDNIQLEGKVNYKANYSGAPRIFCGHVLVYWLHKNFQLGDIIEINITDKHTLHFSNKPIKLKSNKGINNNNHQRKNSVSNAHVGREFEDTAKRYLSDKGIIVEKNLIISIGINDLKKEHAFDLGNKEDKIIVECKSHKWTSGGNVPSAKLTTWNEAMYYFAICPNDYNKLFIVLYDYSTRRKESLADYYYRTYFHLIPNDVRIIEISDDLAVSNIIRD